MERTETDAGSKNWMKSVFTDVHFWVPLVVLIGGLILLDSIR
jgi:hypothetical protein